MSSGKPRPAGKQRRALSTARAPGRIERGGAPGAAAALAAALEAARDDEMAASVTHPLHTYPARMHPGTARRLIDSLLGPDLEASTARSRPVLLDPFCGSGTTLVEGRHAGARCVGIDANPLAVSITRAKTWTVPAGRRRELARAAADIAGATLAEGKAARRSGYEPPPERVPPGVDPRARERAIRNWFAPHVRRELEFMAGAIDRVRDRDPELGELLMVLLSAILYKVSRRTSDTDPTRVDRKVPRGAAARLYRQRAELLEAGLDELAAASDAPVPRIRAGDARRTGMAGGSVDAVVTSPPYPGTYDYAEHHRLRLDFLGLSAERLAADELGARRGFHGDAKERRRALRAWRRELAASLVELGRVLRPGGSAALMIGDSLAGRSAVRGDDELQRALPDGLSVHAWAWQERPELGRREREAFGDRPKREHVVWLRR